MRLAAELRTASRTLRRGPMDRTALQGLAYPVRFQAAAARSMEVGRTGEYHCENRVFPVVGDSYRPTTKIGDAIRKCGRHYYTICELHGSEMCGREINKLATNLISKILISRGQVKIESRHKLLQEGHNNIMVFNKSSSETVSFDLPAFLYV